MVTHALACRRKMQISNGPDVRVILPKEIPSSTVPPGPDLPEREHL